MIFVIKSDKKMDRYDERSLHDKLYNDLNQGGKNQVVVLPEGCTYDVINDYQLGDVKVIVKEIAKD